MHVAASARGHTSDPSRTDTVEPACVCVCALRSLAFSLTINVIVIGGKVVKALTLGGPVLNSTGFIQWMQRRPPPAVKACL